MQEVIYTRGLRRVEGEPTDGADYKRVSEGIYIFHTRLNKGDFVVRERYGNATVSQTTYKLDVSIPAGQEIMLGKLPLYQSGVT
jgi:hypothetical protein